MKLIYFKIMGIILSSVWIGIFITKELAFNAVVQSIVVISLCGTLYFNLQELRNENPS